MRTQANAAVQAAIETIDIGANTASASAASSCVGSAAIRSSTTAPVPASPWSSPIEAAWPRAAHPHVAVRCAAAAAQVAAPCESPLSWACAPAR